jgi:hypothetical protein
LGIDVEDLVNPWEAAMASATSFLLGGVLPLLAILLPPHSWRVPVCFAAVLITLSLPGTWPLASGGPRRTRHGTKRSGSGSPPCC